MDLNIPLSPSSAAQATQITRLSSELRTAMSGSFHQLSATSLTMRDHLCRTGDEASAFPRIHTPATLG